MPPGELDEQSLPADAGLLRRIHPDQVVPDSNTGGLRPSSAAFKDENMSVDIELVLERNGLNWQFTLRDYPKYSLVRFPAGSARAVGLSIMAKPLPDNPAHAEVVGKKTQGAASKLRKDSAWVHIAVVTNEP